MYTLDLSNTQITSIHSVKEGTRILKLENCTKLTEIPSLPNSIETMIFIYCTSLQKLPTSLPKSLKLLDCSFSKIENLPELPDGLEILLCDNTNLKKLPKLPESLLELSIDRCWNFKELPVLPSSLQTFRCQGIDIEKIEKLPKKLGLLKCSFCMKLKQLPEIPSSMHTLICTDMHIKELKLDNTNLKRINLSANPDLKKFSLPESLKDLNISYCSFDEMPRLPTNLYSLDCSNNDNLKNISPLPPTLEILICNDCPSLNISKLELPDSLHYIEYNQNGFDYNEDLKCWYHIHTGLVYKNENNRTIIGRIVCDDKESIEPLNKESIELCKKYNLDYEKEPHVEEAKNIVTCVICMTNQPSIMMTDCHHIVYCSKCYCEINDYKCPKCRKVNKGVITVYF